MIFLYDGSFEGFLSVIFECYSKKITPLDICSLDNFQEVMFAEKIFVPTNTEHSNRVWKGWQKKMSKDLNQLPFLAFLSAQLGIEMNLFHFARLAFASTIPIEGNYSDFSILEVRRASRRVTQEAMRMLQFVRFQQTKDNIYFSGIRPRYDVMPMTLKHFKDRFADQHWLVYDLKRDYGFYYNLKTVDEVTLGDKAFNTQNGKVPLDILQDDEAKYQSMWNNYCQNITIRERLNLKLQKQHMPKRYWQFLPEKSIIK
ncbi:MAG: TIGR03915 family putative DNA repair protein [Prolixibacteraceae bacterium]|jgi:probable DNA metabolism protein|nr:TIGR03915 family putative DNA repair protein [Prolixibacteraceae bacterium]